MKKSKQYPTTLKPSVEKAMLEQAAKREMNISEFIAYCVKFTIENDVKNHFLSK